MFSRCFLHLSLVNLPLLASLEERSTHGVLGCFLGVGDGEDLEEGFLADEAAEDGFVLLWEAMLLGVRLEGLFLHLPCTVAFMVSFPVAVIDSHC